MNASNLKIAIASSLIGASLATGVQAIAQHDMHHMGGGAQSKALEPGAMQLHNMMMKMGADMAAMKNMSMDNDTDRMFAKSMADHHAMGVKMAQVELKYGNDPATKALARKIAAVQSKEIVQLRKLGKTAK